MSYKYTYIHVRIRVHGHVRVHVHVHVHVHVPCERFPRDVVPLSRSACSLPRVAFSCARRLMDFCGACGRTRTSTSTCTCTSNSTCTSTCTHAHAYANYTLRNTRTNLDNAQPQGGAGGVQPGMCYICVTCVCVCVCVCE